MPRLSSAAVLASSHPACRATWKFLTNGAMSGTLATKMSSSRSLIALIPLVVDRLTCTGGKKLRGMMPQAALGASRCVRVIQCIRVRPSISKLRQLGVQQMFAIESIPDLTSTDPRILDSPEASSERHTPASSALIAYKLALTSHVDMLSVSNSGDDSDLVGHDHPRIPFCDSA